MRRTIARGMKAWSQRVSPRTQQSAHRVKSERLAGIFETLDRAQSGLQRLQQAAEVIGPTTASAVRSVSRDVALLKKLVFGVPGAEEKRVAFTAMGYLDGPAAVSAALRAARRPVGELYAHMNCDMHLRPKVASICNLYERRWRAQPTAVDAAELMRVRGFRSRSPVLLQCGARHTEQLVPSTPFDLLPRQGSGKRGIYVAVDNTLMVHNVATTAMMCYAMGVEALIFSGPKREITPSMVNASAGATEFVDMYNCPDLPSLIKSKRDDGFRVVGTVPWSNAEGRIEGAKALQDVREVPDGPVMIIFGGERDGVRQEALRECSELVYLPPIWADPDMAPDALLDGPFHRLQTEDSAIAHQTLADSIPLMGSVNVSATVGPVVRHYQSLIGRDEASAEAASLTRDRGRVGEMLEQVESAELKELLRGWNEKHAI